jgi:hypothetical protein
MKECADKWLRLLLFALGLSLFALQAAAGETMRIVHAAPEISGDQRATYFWELLSAALESNRHIYGDYEITSYPVPMSHARIIAEMEADGQGRVNIFVPATNPDLETRLLPVRIPVDKGLLGYRLFLIMPETQSRLEAVRNVDDLRKFTIGQGEPWADSRILEAQEFKLVLANGYDGMFKMLDARRFDLFSRGIDEIGREWRLQKALIPNLQIERNLILHYPLPRYYFVPRTKRGERMAERIEDGLRRLAKSGEFDRRYAAYKRSVLDELDLNGRRVLQISNPFFTPAIPYTDKRWWDDLSSELKRPGSKLPKPNVSAKQ